MASIAKTINARRNFVKYSDVPNGRYFIHANELFLKPDFMPRAPIGFGDPSEIATCTPWVFHDMNHSAVVELLPEGSVTITIEG